MIKFALIVIFFALASADKGIVQDLKFDSISVYKCFVKNGITLMATTAWDQQEGPNYHFNQTVKYGRMAGIYNHDAIITLSDLFEPEEICRETVNVLPADFNGTVWVNPGYDFISPVEDRMDYLDSVIRTCQQHGLNLGIYSRWSAWQEAFNDRYASSSVVQALPLFYRNADVQDNFEDFQSAAFGKWAAPTMKNNFMQWIFCEREVDRIFF